MKVIVAMKPFKGSLSASEACDWVELGVRQAFDLMVPEAQLADYTCVKVPISDGSAEFIANVGPALEAQGFKKVTLPVYTANLKQAQVEATMLVRDKECYIEAAQALDRAFIKPRERNILTASSYGLGQMIDKALELGCNDIKIGLGDVASHDLGLGMAQALGVTFSGLPAIKPRKKFEDNIINNIEAWRRITDIDDSALRERLEALDCKVTILTDQFIPLTGENGSTMRRVVVDEAATAQHKKAELSFMAGEKVLSNHYDYLDSEEVGAGAGGGLGAALMCLMNAKVVSGSAAVLDILNIEQELKDADLIISGEGCFETEDFIFDRKVLGLAFLAQTYHVPLWMLCGEVDSIMSPALLHRKGVTACMSTCHSICKLEDAFAASGNMLMGTAINSMIMALTFNNNK